MALWTPNDAASSPVFWLDAATSSSLVVSGGLVSYWASRVGSGSASQSDASRQPVYSETALNAKPGVVFDGNDDFMSLGAKDGFPTDTAGSTIAMIGGDGGGSGDRWILVYGTDNRTRSIGQRDPAGFASLIESSANPSFGELDNGGSFDALGGFGVAAIKSGASTTMTSTFDGGAIQSVVKTGVVGNTSLDYGYLGAFGGSQVAGLYWKGPMQEVLLWDYDLSTADRQKLEGYMAWRWGQQGRLPSSHPYKAAAPTTGAPGVTASAASTLGNILAVASALLLIGAQAAIPLPPIVSAGAGGAIVRAYAAPSLGSITSIASASVRSQAAALVTLGDVGVSSTAAARILASGALTLAPVSTVSAGVAHVNAAAAAMLGQVTLDATAAGKQIVVGQLAATIAPVTISSTAAAPIAATSAIILSEVRSSGSAGAAPAAASAGIVFGPIVATGAVTIRLRGAAALALPPIACVATIVTNGGSTMLPVPETPSGRRLTLADLGSRSLTLTDSGSRRLTL